MGKRMWLFAVDLILLLILVLSLPLVWPRALMMLNWMHEVGVELAVNWFRGLLQEFSIPMG